MGIPRNLSNLAPGASSTGVLDVTKGGTGLATVGTNGQVLQSNGTSLVYATPSAGAMTLISTVTANNTSQYVTFTNISGYSAYLIIINNLAVNTSGNNPYLEFGTGSGPTWQTSNYSWVLSGSQAGSAFVNQTPNTSAIIMGFNGTVGPSTRGTIGKILIGKLTGALSKPIIGQVSFYNNGGSWTNFTSMGSWNDNVDVTAIRLDYASNIVSGTASLYGLSS